MALSLQKCVVAVAMAAALLGGRPAAAQAPAGPEFQVNTYTTGSDIFPSVATDAAGNFAVSWVNSSATPSVRVRRFGAQGAPIGGDLVVDDTSAEPVFSHLAMAPGGAFVVVWSPLYIFESDVFGRRFDASGTPLGPTFRVDSSTTGEQEDPWVAAAASGAFVVVWTDWRDTVGFRVLGRLYAADGTPSGADFEVDPQVYPRQREARIAMDPSGHFVVVWKQDFLYGRRFAPDGSPLGAAFAVENHQDAPRRHSVAMLADGGFVVAWSEYTVGILELWARLFAPDGQPRGSDFVVHTLNADYLSDQRIAVAGEPGGGFVLSWSSTLADSSFSGVEARRFDAAARPLGRSFRLNTTVAGVQVGPALAVGPDGGLIAVWMGSTALGLPYDILGQRFGLLEPAALEVDTVGSATSNGNRVLERGETTDVRPSWRNNTAAPRDLPATLTGLTGPAGATYTIDDGTGAYGTVPPGGAQACIDCYRVGVAAAARPSVHWDFAAAESIDDGSQSHTGWSLHVGESFDDVPRWSPYYRFVETLLHRAVTGGCGPTTYCTASPVTREQMAVFVLASKEDAGYQPRWCSSSAPRFADVPYDNGFCRWIEELARRGVTGGCDNANYCPHDPVSREQMAVFLLRTLDPALNPPACTTPVFSDVPASSGFCRWIEELVRRGITAGCGGGNYCPQQPVTREQMAVFLTTTFGLTLYGP